MSKFNKLYNLILESILTEDILSKIRKAIQTLIKSGLLKGEDDPRTLQVKTIIKRNNSIDVNGKTKLDLLLKQNKIILNRVKFKKDSYLDSIPEFSLKKLYPNGVVIYRVELSRAGQAAVRKVIDAQWGEDANPWCLASRATGKGLLGNYKSFWIGKYTSFPKHIAFQNGKLLAFCADSSGNCTWWDRNDKKSKKLKLLDGSLILTLKYYWSNLLLANMFVTKKELILNKETGRYDSDHSIRIINDDIKNGHIPVPLGVIHGNFECGYCTQLKYDLELPTKVEGKYNLDGSVYLPFYKTWKRNKFKLLNSLHFNEATKKWNSYGNVIVRERDCENGRLPVLFGVINGNFNVLKCHLIDLKGAPTKVTGKSNYTGTIIDNKDDEQAVTKDIVLQFLSKHKSLVFNKETQCYDSKRSITIKKSEITKDGKFPIKFGRVEGTFACNSCDNLRSLLNAPKYVSGDFIITWNGSLTSLKGGPEHVGGDYNCEYCSNLITLLGAPKEIGKDFICRGCRNLQSLLGAPKIIHGNLSFHYCQRLTSLLGAPERVEGIFTCDNCYDLTSLVGGPKYVGKYYECDNCDLTNLEGLADYVGEIVACFNQTHRTLHITPLEKKKYKILDTTNKWWPWIRNYNATHKDNRV